MSNAIKKLSWYRPLSEIFEHLHENENAAFLDSSLIDQKGRYSVIGLNAVTVFSSEKGVAHQDGLALSTSFEEAIESFFAQHKRENTSALPLAGGGIGYFTYDFGLKYLDFESRHKMQASMPEAYVVIYDNFLIEDCHEKELFITASGFLKEESSALEETESWLKNLPDTTFATPKKNENSAQFTSDFTAKTYQAAVEQLIQYMAAGDIYIANMTQQLEVKSSKSPIEVYRYLRAYNPAPFAAYLNYGDYQVLCASPERFLFLKDGTVETRPIKGTRRRGDTPEEDAALREELRLSRKERSELLMIVDLLRNDLNRVCETGSVKVRSHYDIEEYATVFHLVTAIEGRLSYAHNALDLLHASFPGGSITGAPKRRAVEIIDELESTGRGLYTGSIGYISLDGACDLNIVIRTALYQAGVYRVGVGGGITYESDPAFEYQETLQKARALLEALYDGKN